jgi:outer membrane autotransporter protein
MFDKTTSQRVGLGLRGSREFTLQNDVRLGVSLTGRVQEELDGEATAKIGNLNPISPEVRDEFDGSFSELIGGLTLTNRTGRVSGALNVGGKFGDDYEALSGSVSFRYQW